MISLAEEETLPDLGIIVVGLGEEEEEEEEGSGTLPLLRKRKTTGTERERQLPPSSKFPSLHHSLSILLLLLA